MQSGGGQDGVMSKRRRGPLRVLFLSAEVESFAKTGGLGDVAAALPKALRRLGVDVRICMPRHALVPNDRLEPQPLIERLPVPIGNWQEPVTVRRGWLAGARSPAPVSEGSNTGPAVPSLDPAAPGREQAVPVYLIENARYFDRPSIYGHADDGERFIIYCRAALELCRALHWAPDIIHCNDWHTALVPNWLCTLYQDDPLFADTATVYTIHNLAYQGIFDFHFLWLAGLAEHGFLYPKIPDLADVVDLMGRGILFADVITTVSERYAAEILSPEYGERLDPLLRERKDRLFGILNGIDTAVLDPATDPYIPVHYDLEHLERRRENKLALQREAALPVDAQVPLVGMIGRLSGQKGLDLLAPIAEALLRQGIQLVVLGVGDEHYAQLLRRLERDYPNQVRAFLRFDTPLAQRIYAGSDIFLMPSRYEPCGLGQMIAMRYGSVPVVRETGGLADTVAEWDPQRGTGTGFRFERYDPLDCLAALMRALETYRYPEAWRRLQRNGMACDFSWDRSASKYVELYLLALRTKERAA
jgi:starch synthase